MSRCAAACALSGTLCLPDVFGPMAQQLRGEVEIDALSWLTGPGPWVTGRMPASEVDGVVRGVVIRR
jgi:hypothetical protein